MRWRRTIVAVGVGLAVTVPCTIVLSARFMPRLQEVAAAMVPQWVAGWAYIAPVDSVVAGLVTLRAILVAVLIAATGRKPEPRHCGTCGYDLFTARERVLPLGTLPFPL